MAPSADAATASPRRELIYGQAICAERPVSWLSGSWKDEHFAKRIIIQTAYGEAADDDFGVRGSTYSLPLKRFPDTAQKVTFYVHCGDAPELIARPSYGHEMVLKPDQNRPGASKHDRSRSVNIRFYQNGYEFGGDS